MSTTPALNEISEKAELPDIFENIDFHSLAIPGLQATLLNERHKAAQEDDPVVGLNIVVLDRNDLECGSIRLLQMPADSPRALLQHLLPCRENDSAFPNVPATQNTTDDSTEKGLDFRADLLENLVRDGVNQGAKFISTLGRKASDAIDECRSIAHRSPLRDASVRTASLGSTTWLDIDTPLPSHHVHGEQFQAFIRTILSKCHHTITPDLLVESRLLDLRLFELKPDDNCTVERHKLTMLVGNNLLITLHNGEVDCLDSQWSKYESIGDEVSSPSVGALVCSLVEAVEAADEPVIRAVERTAREIANELARTGTLDSTTLARDLPTLRETVNYMLGKTKDAADGFHRLIDWANRRGDRSMFAGAKCEETQAWAEELQNALHQLRDRIERLLATVKEIPETNTAMSAARSSEIQKKTAVIQGVVLPLIGAATVSAVLPQHLPEICISAAVSIGLLVVAHYRRWM